MYRHIEARLRLIGTKKEKLVDPHVNMYGQSGENKSHLLRPNAFLSKSQTAKKPIFLRLLFCCSLSLLLHVPEQDSHMGNAKISPKKKSPKREIPSFFVAENSNLVRLFSFSYRFPFSYRNLFIPALISRSYRTSRGAANLICITGFCPNMILQCCKVCPNRIMQFCLQQASEPNAIFRSFDDVNRK